MADSASRRSFLFGRQATAHDDWSKFVVTLRRACQGSVRLLAEREAHLLPASLDDVIQARQLCQSYHVLMVLQGIELPACDRGKFILWVEAGSAWGSLIPLGDSGLWRVDAGCTLAVMQAAGLVQAPETGGVENLGLWFASAYRHLSLSRSGLDGRLVSIDWLLPNGTIEVFGAFGAQDAQPLASLAAQKLVPKLFELSGAPEVRAGIDRQLWPSRFHLDALLDVNQVNLAHFFIGHGGALGWLVAATFKKTEIALDSPIQHGIGEDVMAELDAQTKDIVDPDKVFVSLSDQNR
ncbi:hypothetical protein [Orrella daihaiensis]|uniref:Uncharacterized protein n=1 Tax=Orrella daihaiensis TaxID=2782176 RepID=A0ABY4ANB3_9BURK|nr:hypothetical protein [Orrella daihaiensis]UOD51116.1 hypothetical protein DHf2319_04230 [Orrella daihaiensis]